MIKSNSHGIMLTDSFQLLKNYRMHIKNQQIIKSRKPKDMALPPRPSRPPIQKVKYRPFLNYTSNFLSLDEVYRPSNSLSCLRIYNENINYADRLQKIKQKNSFKEPPPSLNKTNFPMLERARDIQIRNMEIAKKILDIKSDQIDFKHFSKDFDNHRLYSRLRSKIGQLSMYSRTSVKPLETPNLEFGHGSSGIRLLIQQMYIKGFFQKQDDAFNLLLKLNRGKTYQTGLLTYEQIHKQTITMHGRKSHKRRLNLTVIVLQVKGTREYNVCEFKVGMARGELEGKLTWYEKDLVMRKGTGNARVRVQGWLGSPPKNVMQECDAQYESSSENG